MLDMCDAVRHSIYKWFIATKDVTKPMLTSPDLTQHVKTCSACQLEVDALNSARSFWTEWPYSVPDIVEEGMENQATAFRLALRITRFVIILAGRHEECLVRGELLNLCRTITEMANSGKYLETLSQLPTVVGKIAEHCVSKDLLPGQAKPPT